MRRENTTESSRVLQCFQSHTEHQINRFKPKETFTDRRPKSATSGHKRKQTRNRSTDSLTMKQSFKTTIPTTTTKKTKNKTEILRARKRLNYQTKKNKQTCMTSSTSVLFFSQKTQAATFFFSEYLSKNKVLTAAAYPSTVFEPTLLLPPQCCAYRIWSEPLSLNELDPNRFPEAFVLSCSSASNTKLRQF